MENKQPRWSLKLAVCGLALTGLATSTGCQTLVGGQVLPSPWYQQDDVQYFPAGPEFKLSREAAAQKAYNADTSVQAQ